MGNKLCAPWKRGYRDEDHPWSHKKDSHLLRLWGEIFEVREEDNDICWARVSDDVVPINITCIADNPDTIFQITAYNRHVEKIFDVRLIQPGTRITQASECFVHWRDSRCDHEWGLNFTTPVDARRFRDCCMGPPMPQLFRKGSFSSLRESIRKSPAGHSYARKASSSGSLRLSPPKRVKGGRKVASNPTSPLSQPRRAISSPEELGNQDVGEPAYAAHPGAQNQPLGAVERHVVGSGVYARVEHIATVPRQRQRNIPNAQSVFTDQNGIHKPTSEHSVYDNVSTLRRAQAQAAGSRQESLEENPYETVMVSHRPPPHPNNTTMHRPIAEREIPYSQYQSMNHSSVYASTYRTYNPRGSYRNNLDERVLRQVESRQDKPDGQQSLSDPEEDPYGRTELRQFSREPTMLRISERNEGYTETSINDDYDNVHINKTDDLDAIHVQFAPIDDSKDTLSPPRKSHSSSSPEWPPPPEGAIETLESSTTATKFDSNTLKRMLRSLPDSTTTPVDNGEESDYQPVECKTRTQQAINSSSSSPIRSMYQHENLQNGTKTQSGPIIHAENFPQCYTLDARPPPGPSKTLRISPESGADMSYRHVRSRDSYPDSGVSGMTNDTTGSVRSGDSGRSGRSNKSSTLPAGLGLGLAKSSGGSSGGSSSGRHSDLIRQYGTGSGSETTEIRHLTSDISESETESSSEAVESDTSSIHTMPSESQVNFASKSAAVRKAGWLTVKNWLIHKKRKVELAPKRSWKKYWVCLKGTMLLFYHCDENDSIHEDSVPGHMLVIEGGISQAIPEHPKRENIFSLSTAFGDAYLFQAPSQIELENWISGIHSACASSFARQHGKENTLKLLRSEIQKLENSIDLDIKMKKMAGLQITVVTDPKSKQAIEKQIAQWDENLEKLYMEQYRLRCYMASLQGCELPNPKTLLGCASKSTKTILGRIGVFTVTSFHALVSARTPLTTANLYNTRQKRGLLSTFKADSATKIRPKSPRSFEQKAGQGYKNSDMPDHPIDLSTHEEEIASQLPQIPQGPHNDSMIRISLPNNQNVIIELTEKITIGEVLESACNRRQLNPNDHFVRLKISSPDNYKIPDKAILLQSEEYEDIEVCGKVLFRAELVRGEKDRDFGLQVEAELAEDTEQEDELCVFISDVTKGSPAHRKGLMVGDEILVVNGKVIAELDMVYVENLLLEAPSVHLTIRSCRVERPVNATDLMQHADMYIDNMVCPPPPSQTRISDKVIGELIVPAPNWVQAERSDEDSGTDPSPRTSHDLSTLSSEQINHLLQGAEQVTHFCRLLHNPLPESMTSEEVPPAKPLSDSQRIRKVIIELLETERHYVKDLRCLIERYLEPLKEETYLSGEDIEQLFGNIQEIVTFQKLFLLSLQEAVELEPNFNTLRDPLDFKRVLFSLAGSFLYYANHFKLYSSFCASHSKAQKILNPECNQQLQEFLKARNPKQQHSSTLESFLIKPIQRILKYPLLLKQLKDLTDPQSDEHLHLSEALRGMEAVAEHINEMQKIYEEYGSVFDDLIKQYKENLDLNVGELQMYGTVTWLNALDELGKMKKGTDLITLVFIFKAGVVVLAQERTRGKKKVRPTQGRPPTSIEGGDMVRFQTAICVDELQVRSTVGETERHGVWELIHCRSEKEGRPEKVFQFASSHEARRDFVKVITNTIRESVRRMSIPGSKNRSPSGGPQYQQSSSQQNLQHTPHSGKRPESLVMRSIGKSKGKQVKGEMSRHSMDVEDKVNPHDSDGSADFRTRSQTLTDLNAVDLTYQTQSEAGYPSSGYPSGSQSTIASDSRMSAKLVHASNNPTNYSTSQSSQREGPGSPIWKPRSATKRATVRSPSSEERGAEPSVFSGSSAYGDYSNVVYDHKHSSTLPHPNSAHYDHDHTDC